MTRLRRRGRYGERVKNRLHRGGNAPEPARLLEATPAEWSPPHPFWDLVLQRNPSHLFVFDAALICRYAAPTGDTFLGRPREQLTGRHAAEILPPASNGLRPVLERAARDGTPWNTAQYRYNHHVEDAERSYVWAVNVEPVEMAERRGVLVTLADVPDLAEDRGRLRRENEAHQEDLSSMRLRQAEQTQELAAIETGLRTALTPVLGILQLFARRPELLHDGTAEALLNSILLPELHKAVGMAGDLDRVVDAGFGRGEVEGEAGVVRVDQPRLLRGGRPG